MERLPDLGKRLEAESAKQGETKIVRTGGVDIVVRRTRTIVTLGELLDEDEQGYGEEFEEME